MKRAEMMMTMTTMTKVRARAEIVAAVYCCFACPAGDSFAHHFLAVVIAFPLGLLVFMVGRSSGLLNVLHHKIFMEELHNVV